MAPAGLGAEFALPLPTKAGTSSKATSHARRDPNRLVKQKPRRCHPGCARTRIVDVLPHGPNLRPAPKSLPEGFPSRELTPASAGIAARARCDRRWRVEGIRRFMRRLAVRPARWRLGGHRSVFTKSQAGTLRSRALICARRTTLAAEHHNRSSAGEPMARNGPSASSRPQQRTRPVSTEPGDHRRRRWTDYDGIAHLRQSRRTEINVPRSTAPARARNSPSRRSSSSSNAPAVIPVSPSTAICITTPGPYVLRRSNFQSHATGPARYSTGPPTPYHPPKGQRLSTSP